MASLPPPTDTTSEYARIYARHSESALYHAICYVAGLFDLFLIMFLPQEIRDVVERARLLGFAAEDDSSWMAFILNISIWEVRERLLEGQGCGLWLLSGFRVLLSLELVSLTLCGIL